MGVLAMESRLSSEGADIDASVPKAVRSDKCIRCGHCVAACPNEAMDHEYTPLSGQVAVNENRFIDAETAVQFLRSRRSVRVYKKESISREDLLKRLNIARFAPTGTNAQGLSYLVISDAERLARVVKAAVDCIAEELDKADSRIPERFRESVEEFATKGRDFVLRGAPHLILALAPPEILSVGMDSAKFALEYVELLAPAMGIGTCWMGIIQMCVEMEYPPLTEALMTPRDRHVVGAIAAGYPEYKYDRMPDRNPLDVSWA
jgi:nitroreductase